MARLRTRRDGLRVDGAEVVHDVVSVLDGQRVSRTFDELEVELIEGDERTLRRLEKALRRAGALDGEGRPKLFRALDLADPLDSHEAAPGASASVHLASALGTQYRRLLAHDPGTRLGTDPRACTSSGSRPGGCGRSSARVVRCSTRSGPTPFVPSSDGSAPHSALSGTSMCCSTTCASRSAALDGPDGAGAKTVLRVLGRERSAARRRLLRVLGSARYLALLDRLEAAGDPPLAAPPPELTVEDIWRTEHARLRKGVARLGAEPADDELHDTRIRVKRARYAAELAGLDAYVRVAKTLQDVLGEHQDSVVAEERLRRVAASHPDAAIAAGRLVDRERRRAHPWIR